jgi:DNA-binding HxlR family transcriptional regulator
VEYQLTPAGKGFRAVAEAIAGWGALLRPPTPASSSDACGTAVDPAGSAGSSAE